MHGDPQRLADPGHLAQGPREVEEVLFLHVRSGSLGGLGNEHLLPAGRA